MTTSPSIADRVQAGATFLDERFPGWISEIDLTRLDLASNCNCILGQKFGHFAKGARLIGLDLDAKSYQLAEATLVNLGFYAQATHDACEEYTALTEAWRELIVQRHLDEMITSHSGTEMVSA